jgi:hypothetical protein
VVGEAERRRVHGRRSSPEHRANNETESTRGCWLSPDAGRSRLWRFHSDRF